ncbi:unnamed protein product [Bursaphelenchus okinawaensis]|uniref:2-hydroxyacyl-CoA lyase 2 n=1 Tax=Bursaphelenchus okinawaensis TaxID=465554 RepID=A0A811KZS5_9BILA|nr:unnamed protein product [Bursaphelenchus okinawaensis]CAG9113615.1 unnamed protein product [Bursaphelenchus okinawaensis]
MLMLILFAVAIAVFLKWFLGIEGMNNIKKIVEGLKNGKQHWLSTLFQVEEKCTRHGGELVASVLKAHGVEEIFTLVGGHISPILVSAEKLGIKVIDTRHEVSAVYAADAVARLKQSIGVAAVTAGPGLTNTITAVKNAQMAESPILLIGGAAPTLLKNRGALQDIDQGVLFRPLCKYTARVTKLRDIVPTVRRAIQEAQSGTPGPVFIEFPIDVLYPYQFVVKEMGFTPNAKGFKKILNAYLFTYVSRQFGGAWNEQDLTPLPIQVPTATVDEISNVVNAIRNAKRPLLLMGSQATLPPVSPDQLQETVKKLGIPTYLGGMCRGLLGRSSQIQFRQNRRDALKEADVVVLAGTVCDFRLSYGKVLSSRCKVIAINRCRSQLTKNHRVFWNAHQLIQADVGQTLVQIQQGLGDEYSAPEDWIQSLTDRENEKESSNASKMAEVLKDGNLNPLALLKNLDDVLPDDAILVADGGDFVGSAAYIVRPRGPLQWLDPGAFGTLGVGGGFALGAKTVYPGRPVIIIYGDGSAGYSLLEFDTYQRHKLPVLAVIGNDACWSQIARDQVPWFNSSVACDLAFTNYEKIGEAIGAKGILLDSESDTKTQSESFREAIDESRNNSSYVINAMIGKTDFRKGSISV